MAWRVKKIGQVFGVPTQGTPVTAGSFVEADGSVVDTVDEIGLGVVIDEAPDVNPPEMTDAYGEGSILEDTTASYTIGQEVYSDGDGTLSQTQPAGAAGTEIVVVGKAISATEFHVGIYTMEKGA